MSVCNPLAYSLIRDYFPPNRRSTANSIYSSGIYVGNAIASLNIILIQNYGWRDGYMFVGEIGVALALISALILAEPVRERFAIVQIETKTEEIQEIEEEMPVIDVKKPKRDLSIIQEERESQVESTMRHNSRETFMKSPSSRSMSQRAAVNDPSKRSSSTGSSGLTKKEADEPEPLRNPLLLENNGDDLVFVNEAELEEKIIEAEKKHIPVFQ